MISSTEATWSKSSLNTLHMAYNMYVLLFGNGYGTSTGTYICHRRPWVSTQSIKITERGKQMVHL